MKIDEIYDEWEKDTKIDKTQLDLEGCKIPSLHHKYQKLLTKETLVLRKMQAKLKLLRKAKREFLLNPNEEDAKEHGWEYPAGGRKILHNQVGDYLETDKQWIEENLKIEAQTEKTKLIESIMHNINNRSYQLGVAVNFLRFLKGDV
jgi:hypothetical protein